MVQGGLQILKSEAKLKSEGRKQTDFAKLLSGGKRGTKMPISFNSVYFQSQGNTLIIDCCTAEFNQSEHHFLCN